VKALADTLPQDGNVSENEALLLTLDVADLPANPDPKYDINGDGVVNNTDVGIILTELDILVP
jgi:hypothetical protein